MSDADEAVIARCLRRSIDGAYFAGDEFHTLLGLHRHEMETIVDAWPDPPTEAPEGYANGHEGQHVAVNNVLNSLLGYPHGRSPATRIRRPSTSPCSSPCTS